MRGAARTTARLLSDSPARLRLVGADNRIEIDVGLLRDLGLSGEPGRLEGPSTDGAGIDPADLATLRLAIADTRLTAQPIEVQLCGAGSDRIFEARDGPEPVPSAKLPSSTA